MFAQTKHISQKRSSGISFDLHDYTAFLSKTGQNSLEYVEYLYIVVVYSVVFM